MFDFKEMIASELFKSLIKVFTKLEDYEITIENNKLVISSSNIPVNILNSKSRVSILDSNGEKIDINKSPAVIESGKIIFNDLDEKFLEKLKYFIKDLSNEKVIESNFEGEVIERNDKSKIYVKGILVAEEDNLLYSYNIKNPTKNMIKKLENLDLPFKKTAFVYKLKNILLLCENTEIAMKLANEIINSENIHDEIRWKDVQIHALKLLNALNNYLFITKKEIIQYNHLLENAKNSGYKIIEIPEEIKEELLNERDILGNKINTIQNYFEKYSKNFVFEIIDEKKLSEKEKENFQSLKKFLSTIDKDINVLISNNMLERIDSKSFYYIKDNNIYLKRDVLNSFDFTLKVVIEAISKILYPSYSTKDAILSLFVKHLSETKIKETHVSKVESKNSFFSSFINKLRKKSGD